MNWNRGKNSSAEKAVNGGGKLKQWIGVETRTLRKRKLCIEKFYCMLGLGGKLNNELDSKQELFGRESCEWKNLLHVQLWGGSLNNELESRQELFGRALGGKFKQWTWNRGKNLGGKRKLWQEWGLHVELWGGSLNNELESWQELFSRESCEWGGKFKQWIGVETRTLRKRKLCIEKFYCMLGLGGKI